MASLSCTGLWYGDCFVVLTKTIPWRSNMRIAAARLTCTKKMAIIVNKKRCTMIPVLKLALFKRKERTE